MRFFLLIPLVLIVVLGTVVAGFAGFSDRTQVNVLTDRIKENVLASQEQVFVPVTLEALDRTYEISVPKGSSVYDLMVYTEQAGDFSFSGKEFPGMGFFVKEINQLSENPRRGNYWIYYINNKKAEIGISVYIVQLYDVISWKYEKEHK